MKHFISLIVFLAACMAPAQELKPLPPVTEAGAAAGNVTVSEASLTNAKTGGLLSVPDAKLDREKSTAESMPGFPTGKVPLKVANIPELRLLAIPDGGDAVVLLECHTRVGDGGGGIWLWDPSFEGVSSDDDWDNPANPDGPPLLSPAALGVRDDNGTFIKPGTVDAAAPGRWRRQDAMNDPGVVHANWFGADPSGTHESAAAIQAAHDALPVGTYNEPRRVRNLENGSDTPVEARKYLRKGIVVLAGRYLLERPLELSAQVILRGSGKNSTTLIAKSNTFALPSPPTQPNYADEAEEVFLIRFSKPFSVNFNNCFNTGVRDLTILGGAAAGGNTAVSGIHIFGAQGSLIHEIEAHDFGFRGVENLGIPFTGQCWIEGCMRGPLVDFSGAAGQGQISGNISIEHNNQSGLYVDPGTGLPYAAMRIRDTLFAHFENLAFEASPVEISALNCRRVSVGFLGSNAALTSPVNGYLTHGVFIQGDSYDNSFPDWKYHGDTAHARKIWDASSLAMALDKEGERSLRAPPKPPDFVVTAVADDDGTPVAATVIRKTESRGWYVTAPTAAAATSDCTLTISGRAREWCGQDAGAVGYYKSPFDSSASALGELMVSRGSSDGLSGRVQKLMLLGKGTALAIAANGPDITFGSDVPPAAVVTVDNTRNPAITIAAANTATCSTNLSISIEIK